MATHDYLGVPGDPVKARLRQDVTLLMLKGAGYGAIVSGGVVFFVLIFYWAGLLLPEESKEAEDPTPFSYNMTIPASETSVG